MDKALLSYPGQEDYPVDERSEFAFNIAVEEIVRGKHKPGQKVATSFDLDAASTPMMVAIHHLREQGERVMDDLLVIEVVKRWAVMTNAVVIDMIMDHLTKKSSTG